MVGAAIITLRPKEAEPYLDFLVPEKRLESDASKELLERSFRFCRDEEESKVFLAPNLYPEGFYDFFKEVGFEKDEKYPAGLWMKKELEDLSERKTPEGYKIQAVEDLDGPISAADLGEVHKDYMDPNYDLENVIGSLERRDKKIDDMLYSVAKSEEEDKVIGFSIIVFIELVRGDRIAQNNGLVVKEEHRNKGIGGALLKDSFHRAKEKGYEDMYISTHSKNPAQRLYRRVGFELVTEHPNLCYEIKDKG